MRIHASTFHPTISLLGVAVLVTLSGGCRTNSARKPLGRTTPATFESAPSGPHRVGHAPGTCDLCDLYYKARTHVVRVHTQTGLGAGIIVTASGRILTNAHVAGDDLAPVAETYGGDLVDSRVLRADADLDLAVLQAAESAVHWEPVSVEPCPLPEVGSDVYVIGHPVGLGWTVTRGVVSATREAGEVAPIPLIQTDAAISPGNSGGPLLDRDGRLLGVVSRKLAGPGIESVGFAIPVSLVREFMDAADKPQP